MIKTIAAIALTVGLLVFAPPADAAAKKDADGSPGCISHREFINMQRGTMSQVEERNGVTGLGKVVVWTNGGNHVVKQYPWCDHPLPDMIQISYDRNVSGQYMANYVSEFDFSPLGH